jgi:SAM-dependent methyltransferase
LSYAFVKKEIEDLQPSSILDLGCGLNPIILASKGMEYYALDINKEMLDLVKNYFSEQQISGGVLLRDLRQIDNLNLPRTDMCLILKVFDVLEKKGHKLAENILDSIKSKLIVVSFSTKTLSGKKMNHPQRGWIERLFKRKGFSFKTFKVDNEIFYFAAKERD